MRRLVEFIDWAARIHFVGWIAWAGGGWFVTFLAASAYGWDPVSVWVGSVVVGACCAMIFIAFKVHKYPAFKSSTTAISVPAIDHEPEPTPDINASIAFFEILSNSEWSKQQRPDTEYSVSDWLARRLDGEIHNRLHQGKIKAWGHRCLNPWKEAPENEIPAEEWAKIEIDFAPSARTSALWRVKQNGSSNVVYAGVRFSKKQIYASFPLIAPNETPMPAGVQPDWPIQQLFYHLKPDLLENADEAAWEKIGNDLRDAFGLNLVRVWGRPLGDGLGKLLGERPTLRLIDPSYWHSGHFTYAFFDDTSGDAAHTYTEPNSRLPEYTDLRVNRGEALNAWRR